MRQMSSLTTTPEHVDSSEPAPWFGEEVQRLLPKLLATAVRLTRNSTEAEDLVADTLVKAWGRLDTLRDRAALHGWLSRILTNTFVSGRRSGSSRTERSFDELAEDEEGKSFSLFERLHQPFLLWQANPEQQFLDRLLREDLVRAIDALPDVYRVVVLLVDVQGFAYQEVADSLSIPIGTVRSRLARGRSLLQEALWKHAVDAGLEPGSDARSSR